MKKLIAILVLGVSIGAFGIMVSVPGEKEGSTEYDQVHDHLRSEIYPKLYKLTDYSPKKSFSRCPSGFAHSIDEGKSTDLWVYGTMYYRQGCSSDVFCDFKMNLETNRLFMKDEDEKTYASMDAFVNDYDDDTSSL